MCVDIIIYGGAGTGGKRPASREKYILLKDYREGYLYDMRRLNRIF